MQIITTRLDDEANSKLKALSKKLDRNKSYLMRKAIKLFLEDEEDYLDSIEIL